MIRFAVLLLFLCTGAKLHAHRLDEYLQATRIELRSDSIGFEFDLTPGVAILPKFLKLVDANGDGRIDDSEARAYVEKFLSSIKLDLDGVRIPISFSDLSAPTPGTLETGLGTFRIKAATKSITIATGLHQLRFENSHAGEFSVYLVNALHPTNSEVRILRQTRDELQKIYFMTFIEEGAPK